MFAYRYFKIGMEMPMVVQGKEIPEKMKVSNKRRERSLLVLNIVLPIFAAVALYFFVVQIFPDSTPNSETRLTSE